MCYDFIGAATEMWRTAGEMPRQVRSIRACPEFIEGWDRYRKVKQEVQK
jgi:hypothetical protein